MPKREEIIEDKENEPPKISDKQEEYPEEQTEDKPCAKCTKRRLADVQPQNNGALCESSLSPNKRARHDSDSGIDKYDVKCADASSGHEPMQTEQISNLVHRFNSGLSGLLGTSHSDNSKNSCQSESIVQSCGTQITFSESLGSRPVIALTV